MIKIRIKRIQPLNCRLPFLLFLSSIRPADHVRNRVLSQPIWSDALCESNQ